MNSFNTVGVFILIASLSAADPSPTATIAATGYFHTCQVDGRWWLVDGQGRRFLSKGVTTVQFDQDSPGNGVHSPYGAANLAAYGTVEAWSQQAATRLLQWGFNTLGAWSDERLCRIQVDGRSLACAPVLNIGVEFMQRKTNGNRAWQMGLFPDVFDPDFTAIAHEIATRECVRRRESKSILGWFTDNELRWGPDWRGKDELLTLFLNMPIGAPGRIAAVELLRRRYGDIAACNTVWQTGCASWDDLLIKATVSPPFVRPEVFAQNQEVERQANGTNPIRAAFCADCEEFSGELAERYFFITSQAIHAADPNHMIFGARFAYVPPQSVVNSAARYIDVVSFNCYAHDPRSVIRTYATFGKPVIIGEFSFRGRDSGMPNTRGAGPVVATQTDRANAFTTYVTAALAEPSVVGFHWFEHADQPKEGRFDGENSNYGLVDVHDQPYAVVVSAMAAVNAQAEQLHQPVAKP